MVFERQEQQRLIEMEIKNIEGKYEEVYLLRNEEVYTIYDFKKGWGFCPDFIPFLTNDKKESEYYQVFIEPKGDWALGNDGTLGSGKDGWKQEFLEQISEEYGVKEVLKFENIKYRMIGLPFFNMDHNENFKKGYDKLLD